MQAAPAPLLAELAAHREDVAAQRSRIAAQDDAAAVWDRWAPARRRKPWAPFVLVYLV